MQVSEHRDGATCWTDLSAGDIGSISEFYGALFGWTRTEGPPETGGYGRFSRNGHDVAGVAPRMSPEQPLVWTTYIQTSDIGAIAAKAASLGATVIVAPMAVMSFGSMAVFIDPWGAALGLWQPDVMKGFELKDEHGSWAWTELMTSDVPGAVEFYGELFGWIAEPMPDAGIDYQVMKIGDEMVAGVMARPEGLSADVPNFWSIYFTVDSLADATEIVTSRGGTVVVGPQEVGPGTFIQFMDPQGSMVGLLQPRA